MQFFSPKTYEFETVFPLWHEAFGDSAETVRQYLEAIRPHSRLFLAMDENIPVSMLFAVEEQVLRHKIFYIYAVATAKTHRGRGLAAQLLRFAEDAVKMQASACILCPAEPSLGAYYARLGYKPWSAAGRDCGPANTVPEAIRDLDSRQTPVLAMAKIFDPTFPPTGTFRHSMG